MVDWHLSQILAPSLNIVKTKLLWSSGGVFQFFTYTTWLYKSCAKEHYGDTKAMTIQLNVPSIKTDFWFCICVIKSYYVGYKSEHDDKEVVSRYRCHLIPYHVDAI